MKTLLLIVTLAATMSARDSRGERFADQHRKQERTLNHTIEAWATYCKSKDMIPDKNQGCVPMPPQRTPVTPYTPPLPTTPAAPPVSTPSNLTHK